MKTLILYSTKHGAAREIARRIADRIDGAVVYDLKQGGIPSITEFDCVIIGSSLYAGMIRKEAKAFMLQNADILRGTKLGLFLSGIEASQEKEYFKSNFLPDILKEAKAASFLGGIYDPIKAGMIERLIMKAAAKRSEYLNYIDDEKIERFALDMKA